MANVFSQIKDVYKLQREAKEMQKKMREQKITGQSDDGRVKLFMNGAQELEDVFIDDTLLSPDMSDILRKGFKEAFKDFQKKLQKELASNFDLNDIKRALGN